MHDIKIDIDTAMDWYISSKRTFSDTPVCGFDTEKEEFVEMKESVRKNENVIDFINSNKVANEVIDLYLNQPGMEEHKKNFRSFYQTGNRVTDILWYFEHIDGAYLFEDFECIHVVMLIKKWCKKHSFSFTEPEIYKV